MRFSASWTPHTDLFGGCERSIMCYIYGTMYLAFLGTMSIDFRFVKKEMGEDGVWTVEQRNDTDSSFNAFKDDSDSLLSCKLGM